MDLEDKARDALAAVRDRILDSPDFPLAEEERSRLADYRLRAAGPDRASVSVEVEVVRGGIDGERGAAETVTRAVELTPQLLARSPRGLRYFVAWNHVARTLVIWFTSRSLAALRDGRRPDGPGRVLPLAGDQPAPGTEGDDT